MLGWLDTRCLIVVSKLYVEYLGAALQRSMIWFLQMAQLSTTISQAHNATAFHCRHSQYRCPWARFPVCLTFLTSKRFLPSASAAPPAFALPVAFFTGAVDPEGTSVISTSAMLFVESCGRRLKSRSWRGICRLQVKGDPRLKFAERGAL